MSGMKIFGGTSSRNSRQFVTVLFATVLELTSAVGEARTAFEFFVVSGSSSDTPSVLTGTSELEDSRNIQICDALSKGDTPDRIANRLRLPASEVQMRIDMLVQAELLRRSDADSVKPTFPIVRRADAAWFTRIDLSLIDVTVRSIEARQAELRARFRDLLHLDASQERSLSLVLFGDILFDRWQTRHVRERFLQGYPPPRNGKLFYVAGLERVEGLIASLGIYTHSEPRYGDVTVVSYGHTQILDPFTGQVSDTIPRIIESYLAYVRGASRATPTLGRLGFVRAGRATVAVVSQSAYARLPEITGSFSDELLQLLNTDRQKIVAAYETSPYFPAVSFQEFALWWYHFFDAAVVDRLISDGVITVPPTGYATMIVAPG
jgi:hypothetical protein